MSEESKNNFVNLNKLNSKIKNGNAKFTSAKTLPDGRLELMVEMNREVAEDLLNNESKLKSFVHERKAPYNSYFEQQKREQQYKQLYEALETAKLKDLTRLVKEGKIKDEQELASLNTRYRDILSNTVLDLREKGAEDVEAKKLYTRSAQEYYKTGIYGTNLDLLSNFAATGYYNELNDIEIKEFYDSWVNDVEFLDTVRKVFHSLFKYSVAYIYTGYGNYTPHLEGVSSIPGKNPDKSSKTGTKAQVAYILNELIKKQLGKKLDFNKFDDIYNKEFGGGSYPIKYSLLNPQYIKLEPLGFFDKVTVTIESKGLKTLGDALKKLNSSSSKVSKEVKEYLKLLSPGLKEAALGNKEYTFSDDEISVIYLRKEDYETYAKPRGSRAFDSFDYKDELKKADYATVDGIYNYILKVTVGDKDSPVTDPAILEALAEAFNTPQKAFSIVWNHTLQIEKITTNEVGAILGKAKYEPVDQDIYSALSFSRVFIDGAGLSGDGAILVTKALQSEITAAREKVREWIYEQYKTLALAAGFSTYPVVRWKESVINTDSDAVTRASFMQMLDRKGISIQTYMREMGFDYDTELQRLQEEFPLIQQDILRAGSPYQVKTSNVTINPGDQGRPSGQPSVEKQPVDETKVVKRKTEVTTPSQASLIQEEEPLSENTEDIEKVTLKDLIEA